MFLLQLPIWSYLIIGAAVLTTLIALVAGRRVRQERVEIARRARLASGILRTLTVERVKRAVGISADEPANQ
jgi:hypothetical protein